MTRSQATPASSQMITMARIIEERDETIAALEKQRDELLAALLLSSCCLEPNTSTATVNQIEAAITSVKEQEK